MTGICLTSSYQSLWGPKEVPEKSVCLYFSEFSRNIWTIYSFGQPCKTVSRLNKQKNCRETLGAGVSTMFYTQDHPEFSSQSSISVRADFLAQGRFFLIQDRFLRKSALHISMANSGYS